MKPVESRPPFMNSNKMNTVLTFLLAASLLWSVLSCLQYIFQSRELRSLSGQVNGINMYRGGIQALAADCLQYASTNAALNPILESVGLKKSATGAAPKAAAK